MAKRNIEPIWVARTAEWHVTYDRLSGDYSAFIDGELLIFLGCFNFQGDAVQACRDYIRAGLVVLYPAFEAAQAELQTLVERL